MGREEIGIGKLPDVYITNISVTESAEDITLEVTISLKDMVNDTANNTGTWVGSKIHNYADIVLLSVATKSNQMPKNLERERIIEHINNGKIMPNEVLPGFNIKKEVIPLSTKYIDLSSQGAWKTVDFHLNSAGEKVYDFYYKSAKITFPKKKIKDVYLYACVDLNIQELANNLSNQGVSYNFSFIKSYSGYVASEVVYLGGEIQNKSFYFVEEDTGQLWIGQVHQHPERGFMGGAHHTDEPHPSLLQIPVQNTKINYKKYSEMIEEEPFSLESMGAFSEVELSYDNKENVTMMFFFDNSIASINNFEESRLLYMYNPEKFNELQDVIDITNISIQREMLKKENQMQNRLYTRIENKQNDYLNNKNDKIVVRMHSTENNVSNSMERYLFDNTMELNLDFDSLPESLENPTNVSTLNISKESLKDALLTGRIEKMPSSVKNVDMYAFTDFYATKLKGTEYIYTIQITAKDKIKDYIIDKLKALRSSILEMEKYYILIDRKQNYDYILDRPKLKFVDLLNNNYGFIQGSTTATEAPWIKSIVDYTEVSSLLSNEEVNINQMLQNIAPTTGNLQSISSTIEEMKKLLNLAFSKYSLSESHLFSEGNTVMSGGSMGGGERNSIVKINHEFRTIVNTAELDLQGFDYIKSNQRGLQKINKLDFETRAEQERKKFFIESPSFKNMNVEGATKEDISELSKIEEHKYSYLTPQRIKAGGLKKDLDGLESSFEVSFYHKLNLVREVKKTAIKRKEYKNIDQMISELTNTLNITLAPPIPSAYTENRKKYIDSKGITGEQSDFQTREDESKKLGRETHPRTKTENIKIFSSVIQDKKIKREKLTNWERVQKISKRDGLKVKRHSYNRQPLKKVPLQIKAMMLRGTKVVKPFMTTSTGDLIDVFADPATRSAAEIFFTKIRKVEVFSGFETVNGINILKKPIWQLMDKNLYESISSDAVCRLTVYSDDFYEINDDDAIKDYNTLFIIEGE